MIDDLMRLQLTAGIVAAYVENNDIRADDLPQLIRAVHDALGMEAGQLQEPAAQVERITPAKARRSIRPDAIISFEDGRPYKQLKRHLTARGLTPSDYRAKWGLPDDYPMVAADYSATRSALAKAAGLGTKAAETPAPEPQAGKAKGRIKGKLGLFGSRSGSD